jgi:hydroxymethylbilane synthase
VLGFKLRRLSLMKCSIKIGTRGSKLALWQANWIKTALTDLDPSLSVEIEIIKTKGDKILDAPLAKVGGKGLFVKEIEDSLLAGRIDLAVHSMKDMPSVLPGGLKIAAVPERESPGDVLISSKGLQLDEMAPGVRIGTSSLRRSSQLRHRIPGIDIVGLRGNLDTRLRKLESENLDGVILAAAGVKRLGLENRITEYLDETVMLPAVGQGALCVETRSHDPGLESIVGALDHPDTRASVLGERAFLARLEGGCQVPMAAHGKIANDVFTLSGLVADVEGTTLIRETLSGTPEKAESIGIDLAERLLSKGAAGILERFR